MAKILYFNIKISQNDDNFQKNHYTDLGSDLINGAITLDHTPWSVVQSQQVYWRVEQS